MDRFIVGADVFQCHVRPVGHRQAVAFRFHRKLVGGIHRVLPEEIVFAVRGHEPLPRCQGQALLLQHPHRAARRQAGDPEGALLAAHPSPDHGIVQKLVGAVVDPHGGHVLHVPAGAVLREGPGIPAVLHTDQSAEALDLRILPSGPGADAPGQEQEPGQHEAQPTYSVVAPHGLTSRQNHKIRNLSHGTILVIQPNYSTPSECRQ